MNYEEEHNRTGSTFNIASEPRQYGAQQISNALPSDGRYNMPGQFNANQYNPPLADPFDHPNSGQKAAQSVGNMSLTEADISRELAGDADDPFNLTASSKRLQPLPSYARNRNAYNLQPRKYAATNHIG